MPLSMFHGGTCRCSDKKQSHDLGLTFSKRKGSLGGDQARGKSSVQIHGTGPVAFSSNHLTEILRSANLVIASEVVSECTPSAEAHRYYYCWWCWRFEQMVRVAQAGSRTAVALYSTRLRRECSHGRQRGRHNIVVCHIHPSSPYCVDEDALCRSAPKIARRSPGPPSLREDVKNTG